jgi:hypothetical protein
MKKHPYSRFTMPTLMLAICGLFNAAQAAVLVDLGLNSDSAVNTASGGIGDGTVNYNTNGYFTNVNSTGNPAGRAFNTGATGMGTFDTNSPNVGTISWANSSFASSFNGTSSFSTYLWIKPDTTPGNNAKLLDMGNVQLTLTGERQLALWINGSTYYYTLAPFSTSEWSMVAVTFSSGTVQIYSATASAENLATVSASITATSINNTSSNLILGNRNQLDRAFDGSIGGFYLATDTSLDIQSTFDSQKSLFIAIPEPSNSAFIASIVILGAIFFKRKWIRG